MITIYHIQGKEEEHFQLSNNTVRKRRQMIGVTLHCQDTWVNGVNLQRKGFWKKLTLHTIGILKWDFAANCENEYLEGFQPYFSLFY